MIRLSFRLAACAIWAVAVFAWLEAQSAARRALHWLACAWMQCDEVRG